MGLVVLQQIKQKEVIDARPTPIKLQQSTRQKQYLHWLVFKADDNKKRDNIKNNRVVRQLNLNRQAATTETVRNNHVTKQDRMEDA